MGIVCEFYLVDDKFIHEFSENPKELEKHFYDNYVNPDGDFHDEGENYFYSDKAWNIASFLISQNDTSQEKILAGLLGEPLENLEGLSYIKTINVAGMNQILNQISMQQIEDAYDESKMKDPYVYNAGYFTKENSWNYILHHVEIIFTAFKKAAENGKAIIVCRG
ncbi:YfbM family protein [Flavobacterium sp. N1736]|uniref:YfbM family protein n=1 Tax=Flavobacterium sp. N1736 TaxID=2986823 RepID=UPI002224F74B|nr:YfbM family protein [Flavobacterium sp. N1736]